MILLLIFSICIIVSFSFLIFGSDFRLYFGILEKILMGITFILISMLLTLIFGIAAIGIATANSEVRYEVTSSKDIIALQDNDSVNGNFFLGTGSVNDKMKYVYMVKDNEGYRMETLNANEVTIVYSDEKKVEIQEARFANKNIGLWFGVPMSDVKYKIYVPEGTIKNEYNIDLQ